MKPILILGLGNPLQGDDGVGCRVAQELEQYTLPDDVEVMDGGTPGVGLLNLFEGRRRVIIVDAAEMGKLPGEVVRFRPEEVTLTGSAQRFSLHRSGVADALALARELGLALPDMTVFGVQPERVDWGEGLSPRVQAAVQQVIESIVGQVTDPLLRNGLLSHS
jgi:hydrogenase maturation protease